MSRFHGNGEACPHGCGLTYKRLRTGETYHTVFASMMDYSPDPADWKRKSRGVVLGRWHEIKQRAWQEHCERACELMPANAAALAAE